ncbi:gliding motility-associated C-terminal domain-containing protein [Pontibacter sp. 172403-2]|uniref:T9SS type B sorting domain-containing protein n=1 Tax=Pontibacter rufus TaxID=2791028 RepID=UPI0018AF85B6|nr:gliding motility-associated C-terminal domain-containing protein [Pontibacter sp. 172403-2]MBF9252980.1 gliding motility-associated C-terminal domain-containing protein [Pontibacter sp. 172403-2]
MRSFLGKVILPVVCFYAVFLLATAQWGAARAANIKASPDLSSAGKSTMPFPVVIADATSADLKITLQKSAGSIAPDIHGLGDDITYTITVENLGLKDETGIKVNILLAGVIKSSSATKGTALLSPTPDNTTSSGAWNIGSLANGAKATLTVITTAKVASNALANVSVAGAGVDSNQSNNFANIFFCVVPDTAGEITGPSVVCRGQSYTYSITAVPGASFYTWTFPEGWDVTIDPDKPETAVVNKAGASGQIKLAVGNTCGQGPERIFDVVSASGKPLITSPIQGEQYPCAGATLTYTTAPLDGAASYAWTVPEGWKIQGATDGADITVTAGTTSGDISVKALNACGEGEAVKLPVYPQVTAPAKPEIGGEVNVCEGSEGNIYSIAAIAGATYSWKVPDGWAIASGQGTDKVTVTAGTKEGTISVTVANSCQLTATADIAVKLVPSPPPTPEAISGPGAVCAGQKNVSYSIKPVSGASSYRWEAPGWTIVSGENTTDVIFDAGASGTSISVVAINACGVTSAVQKAIIVTQTAPAAPGDIKIPASSFCQNTPGLVFSIEPVTGAAAYTWEVPEGWKITAGQGTTNITVTAGTAAGEIKVYASNSCGQGPVKALPVAPQQLPAAPEITIGPEDPCSGGSTAYSVAPLPNVDSYVWELPEGWEIVSGDGTAAIEVLPAATGGTIKVKAVTACGEGPATELNVEPVTGIPAAPAMIQGEPDVCTGRTLSYTIDTVAFASFYTWAVPEGWEITSGQGTATITVVAGSKSGEVAVVAGNGCGTSSGVALQVTAQPLVQLGDIMDLSSACTGLAYEVAPVAGAKTYTWAVPDGWEISSGQGTSKITVTPGQANGSISVVADNGTCQSDLVTLVPDARLGGTALFFPNVFSPNGDGNNDAWVIQNLGNYSARALTVLNRWGTEVYSSQAYQNDWDGGNLSEGTYYYIARVTGCDGIEKAYKGYVTIVR